MSTRSRALRVVSLLLASSMLLASAGFAWAVADDYRTRDIVPAGVSFNGVDLGGLPVDQARGVLEEAVASAYMGPVEVTIATQTATFDPEGTISVDIDAMLDSAFDPALSSTVAQRSYRRVSGESPSYEVAPLLDVDGGSVGAWVAELAAGVDTPSVDATMSIVDGAVVMRHSSAGLETDQEKAVALISEALLAGTRSVKMPVNEVAPQVTDASMGKVIVVDISKRTLDLYDGMTLEKGYRCAVGSGGFPTPKGTWKIVLKRYRPTWYNPAPTGWGATMPASIPPGSSNPLGTRALNLNASGIRIHGTNKDSSIGTAASHGCMRMHRWDIEDLYDRVEVGTPVLIVR
ncbi:MAG: L,D-transpeptidase/peptidoglycan binding protein [Actinobacteria bacterium]|nr:L,D-transpeptidase/peptidoglycan binding protein [Actinomycetota bacterium]MCG2808290.1 L,D-transpeptidase/peptidoglycan binding protein [Coriobacteriia bacterium]